VEGAQFSRPLLALFNDCQITITKWAVPGVFIMSLSGKRPKISAGGMPGFLAAIFSAVLKSIKGVWL
jgi:hypothetical protein